MKESTLNKTTITLHHGPSLLMLSGIYLILFAGGLVIATHMAGGATS